MLFDTLKACSLDAIDSVCQQLNLTLLSPVDLYVTITAPTRHYTDTTTQKVEAQQSLSLHQKHNTFSNLPDCDFMAADEIEA